MVSLLSVAHRDHAHSAILGDVFLDKLRQEQRFERNFRTKQNQQHSRGAYQFSNLENTLKNGSSYTCKRVICYIVDT